MNLSLKRLPVYVHIVINSFFVTFPIFLISNLHDPTISEVQQSQREQAPVRISVREDTRLDHQNHQNSHLMKRVLDREPTIQITIHQIEYTKRTQWITSIASVM